MEPVRAFVHARRWNGRRVSAERIHVFCPSRVPAAVQLVKPSLESRGGGAYNGSCEPSCPISTELKGCLLSSVAMATTEICFLFIYLFVYFFFFTNTAPKQEGTVVVGGGGAM